MADKSYLNGPLATVIVRLDISPGGLPLASVLKAIEREVGNGFVNVSRDFRRATVTLAEGKIAAVRIVPQIHSGKVPFRFNPSVEMDAFEYVYFGWLGVDGEAVVQRFRPAEINATKIQI
jgi:hypothetical protein